MPRDASALPCVSAPAAQSVPEVRGKRNATGQDGPPACVRALPRTPPRIDEMSADVPLSCRQPALHRERMLMRWPGFALAANGSTVRTEMLAGATTFLTMAYIVFVNPDILATTGMDHGAVFVATCLAAALGSLLMGVLANYPIGMAPGMGLNAFFAFGVVGTLGYSWQQTLGLVFVSGCLFCCSPLPARGAGWWMAFRPPCAAPLRRASACSWP